MASKRRSNILKWIKCEKCDSFISSEDCENHLKECPPPKENWSYRFIRNNALHSFVEIYNPKELSESISETEANRIVFLSTSAMEFCHIALGDAVLLIGNNVVVKTAFHSNNSNVVGVSLTKSALELDKLGSHVKVTKLKETPRLAKEVTIEYLGKQPLPPLSSEFDQIIKSHLDESIFAIDNRICIPFYGRKLIFKIVKVKFDTDKEEKKDLSENFKALNISEDNTNIPLYKTVYTTKWIIHKNKPCNEEKKKITLKLDDIGGYSDLISRIRNLMDDALGICKDTSQFNFIKGILLYGPPGIGKSTITNTLMSEYDVNSITISVLNLIPKSHGDSETVLKDLFEDAMAKAPSIILLEDVDIICPKKSSSSTDQERKLLATLINLFDELRYTNANVVVLATTSKLDSVDNSLRRPGRLQKEFEVGVPDRLMRQDILSRILSKIPNDLTKADIETISSDTHGFVAADLEGLCSEARSYAKERLSNQTTSKSNINHSFNIQLTFEDLEYALRNVNPSAMKEALVEVPNVKWTEIGGQTELKLKLKQAVEWPLKHPEVFKRMGIVPPKGVLMFGPPGCSKTMIAKALATESNLNFLNINGPELFSKWVGDSEKAVRNIFRKARQVAPSIIFIDEIDALGGERASSKSNGSNVQERVLTQLLTELDGVTALGNVTLVAATNRPDRIDKALLRPGRLDRIIYVPLPDAETRKDIFSIKLGKMPIADDINIQDLVDVTEGYSGAEIQAICHEAAMNALELDLSATVITKEHFRTALSVVKPRTSVSLIKMYDNYLANSDK